MTQPAYMTRTEAAEWLRCSVDTIDRMCQDRALRFVLADIGKQKRVRIVAADVLAVLPEPREAK